MRKFFGSRPWWHAAQSYSANSGQLSRFCVGAVRQQLGGGAGRDDLPQEPAAHLVALASCSAASRPSGAGSWRNTPRTRTATGGGRRRSGRDRPPSSRRRRGTSRTTRRGRAVFAGPRSRARGRTRSGSASIFHSEALPWRRSQPTPSDWSASGAASPMPWHFRQSGLWWAPFSSPLMLLVHADRLGLVQRVVGLGVRIDGDPGRILAALACRARRCRGGTPPRRSRPRRRGRTPPSSWRRRGAARFGGARPAHPEGGAGGDQDEAQRQEQARHTALPMSTP